MGEKPLTSWSRGRHGQHSAQNMIVNVDLTAQSTGQSFEARAIEEEILKQRRQRFSRAPVQDDDYGLLSRGDFRLQKDPVARAQFFERIQAKYDLKSPHHVDWVLMSLRKLREALVALPTTEFTKEVFLYSVRVSVSQLNHQSYVPAIVHLLQVIRVEIGLSKEDEREILTYLILHKLHYNDAINDAFELFFKHVDVLGDGGDFVPAPVQNIEEMSPIQKLYAILVSYSTRDFFRWVRIYNLERASVDAARARNGSIMDLGHRKVIESALVSIGSAYFVMKRPELESFTGKSWDSLVDDFSCSWRIEGELITIRERKPAKSS